MDMHYESLICTELKSITRNMHHIAKSLKYFVLMSKQDIIRMEQDAKLKRSQGRVKLKRSQGHVLYNELYM